jgi:dethiobiotin synthetase
MPTRMASFFITATGTEIGKTYLTLALASHLKKKGKQVHAIKPIETGITNSENSDSGKIAKLLGKPLSDVNYDTFTQPLTPEIAAIHDGKTIDYNEITTCIAQHQTHEILLIEGAGGIAVPLDEHNTMADLAASVKAKLILVTGSYLGAISHTITALHYAKMKGCELAALVISASQVEAMPANQLINILQRETEVPIFYLQRQESADDTTINQLCEVLCAMST